MNAQAQSLLADLDIKLANTPSARRLDMLRRLLDLFLAGSPSYSQEQIAVFEVVLKRLAHGLDPKALVELSGRLASFDSAPPELVARLSNEDDIAVAGPVLEKSSVLTDNALIGVAKSKSQRHLLAIAARKAINDAVTDVLVERGSAAVRCKVTANAGASFSENGFARLITEARKDEDLAKLVSRREDVPAELQPFLNMLTESKAG